VSAPTWASARQRTAIGRPGLSMPVRQALQDELVSPSTTVLDFGSGRGQDARRLSLMGITCQGWDPYFDATIGPSPHDSVLLNYVLNVIEDPEERRQTLAKAWAHALRVLVVAVRLTWDRHRVCGHSVSDGVVTSRETFQHLFSTVELRDLVEDVTGARCVSPVPGVVYAFRQEPERLRYLARRMLPAHNWSESNDYASALEAVVSFAESHGRLPHFEEIPSSVMPLLGKLPMTQVHRLIRKAAQPDAMEAGARRTTLDTLLYLAIDMFNGRARLSDMPLSVQADIRQHFGTYRHATARASRLLLKLRDDHYVRGAMRNSVGKLTQTALYVHQRAMPSMPIVLRLYEHCGSVVAGRPTEWNILKLHHDSRRVAWSLYPDFDGEPHPRLLWTYGVSLPSFVTQFRNYEGRPNRPLLHRKHEFLDPADPLCAKYQRLTAAEIRAGLYEDPPKIGLEQGWEEELERCGVELRGHRLVKRKT
jgi:DNA phosphorothioation-associated putative methyltransferase